MKLLRPYRTPRIKRRRLPLRLRLALWFGGLVFALSFGLLLFINTVAVSSFHGVVRHEGAQVRITRRVSRAASPALEGVLDRFSITPLNPLELALLLELQRISLIGLGIATLLGGASAYWLAGIALRPVKAVSGTAKRISASTLHTRLALDGPQDEIKELADTFDAMLGRLEQTFGLQSRFVADVAHELRTPLASLRTNLEVVSSDPEASLEDYQAMAATQERAVARLEHLVANLLILVRSEQPMNTCDEVSLEPLLEEALNDLKGTAEAHQVTLQLTEAADVVVRGEGLLLTCVFSNLIENAIYYNHAGGSVQVALKHESGSAVVSVADTGIGIPLEEQAFIFERFHRVDRSRARHKGGAGLGLSMVTSIVQQHGGKIELESAPEVGSVFTVRLPLAHAYSPLAS